MKIGIPKERRPGEQRVAAVPETVSKMVKGGFEVHVEKNAGLGAFIEDDEFANAGAIIEHDLPNLLQQADVILKVRRPIVFKEEKNQLRQQSTIIGPLDPFRHPDLIESLQSQKATAFSLDLLPRIARAQSMDIL